MPRSRTAPAWIGIRTFKQAAKDQQTKAKQMKAWSKAENEITCQVGWSGSISTIHWNHKQSISENKVRS